MIKKFLSSQLKINIVSGSVAALVNIAVMATGYAMYLHYLGYEAYGVWLVLTVVLTFSQLGDLGINSAITKLVAEEHGRNNIEEIQCYIMTALMMLCISGIAMLAMVLIFKIRIISLFNLNSGNEKLAIWLLPYIGILSVYIFIVNVFNSTLSGLGRMDWANYIQTISKIFAISVAIILLAMGLGIKSMIISSFLSYLFIHVSSIICIRRIISIRILSLSSLDIKYVYRLLSFGGTVISGSFINMLLSPFNKVILSRYAGVSTVPVYEIAYTGGMQVRGLIESGLKALMPEISRLGTNITIEAKNRISQLNTSVMKIIIILGLPIYALLGIFAPFLLKIWLGSKFVDTLPGTFQIMLIATFFSLLCVPAYYTLMGLGKICHCFLSHVILGVVNSGTIALLILCMGKISIYSVVISVMLAMATTSLYLVIQNFRTIRSFFNNENNNTSSDIGIKLTKLSFVNPQN